MKQIINNKFIECSLLYFIFLFFGVFISKSFGITMPDDGWRHLAMAIYPDDVQSWGRIYPHSLYQEFDPWFMWHNLLRFIHNFVEIENINIVVNSIIYSFLSFWYYLAFTRFTRIDKSFAILLSIGLPLLNTRYYFLRPDILSGLFILYFLILRNKILLTIISLMYAPFYYVFWFYFAYLSYVHLILKEYKKIIILIVATIIGFNFYLSYDLDGYMQMTQNVLNNDVLLQAHSVGESKPFIIPLSIKNDLGSSVTLLFLILFSLLLYFVFKPKDTLIKYIFLLIPLFLIQYRFLNNLQPLIYVFFIHIFYTSYKIIQEKNLTFFINLIKTFIEDRTYFTKIPKKGIKVLLFILILFYFLLQYSDNNKQYKKLEKNLLKMTFLKDDEFKNKKILFSSMTSSTYMATFLNPSASYIPSCSLGWVTYDKNNKEIYFDLLTNNDKISMKDFLIFIKFNSPDYLIIDTSHNTNLVFSKLEIEKEGYYFYKIINSKLIFRKKQ